MAGGRPSIFSEELAASICGLISCGESLRAICRMNGMPAIGTVMRWVAENEKFREQYREAKVQSQDAVVEEIFNILDSEPAKNPTTGAIDTGHVAWTKNRADARKWYLGKIAPKKYGDKVSNEHTGPDGAPLMPTSIKLVSE